MPQPTLTETDHTAIRRTIADAQRYQNDVEPFLALHTAETVVVNVAGRRVLGRESLGTAMSAAVASPLADVITTVDVRDIRLVRPDVAVVSCDKHISDGRDPAAREDIAFPRAGSLTYVLVRDDDAWRIALAQTTPRAG